MSRVGRSPITVPSTVTVTLSGDTVNVKGPQGSLERQLPEGITIAQDGDTLVVSRPDDERRHRALHGLSRSLVANMVSGVTDGFTKELEIVGVGYRATAKGPSALELALGFSHPILFPLPKGVKCEIPGDSKGTLLILTGSDKEVMGQTAAKIRGFRPPEPYGGKGVRYQGEKVREKAGKAAKAGGK